MDKIKSNIFLGIILLLFIAFIGNYLIMPVWSLNHFSFLFMVFGLVVFTVIFLVINKNIKTGVLVLSVMILFILFQGIRSWSLFTHEEKRALIGEIKEQEFSTEISPIDLNKIPVLDPELAKNLGEKRLGEETGLGSQVTLGAFSENYIDGETYYVAPLQHSGFFKWFNNRKGTPGYILINATNLRDVRLVKEINGQEVRIKYQPNAFLADDLKRKIYSSGYKRVGLTDFSFELNDEFRPYWVVTMYENKTGLTGKEPIGVIVLDAQTGEINEYSMNQIPDWVDRVIPLNHAIKQINYWGKYVHGFWNLSKKDMLKTTTGSKVVYNDGRIYYYTGITSVGADESTTGFMLVDTKTKETSYYRIAGATETAAMRSAEGSVQQFSYDATFPILINIDGEPSYFLTLKDRQGLIKLYSFVNVRDYGVVGIGETIQQARSNYISKLRDRGQWQPLDNAFSEERLQGNVIRIGNSIVDGMTYYYIIINAKEDKIFIAPLNMSNQLPLTKVGDNVEIHFYDSEASTINLSRFNNLEIQIVPSEEEAQLIKDMEKITKSNN